MSDPSRQLIVKHILSGLTGHCQVQLLSSFTPTDTRCHMQKSSYTSMLMPSDGKSCRAALCLRRLGFQLHLLLFHQLESIIATVFNVI